MIDFLVNLAFNLAPKTHQKSNQEAPKIDKKGIISWMLFLIDFLLNLGTSWVDCWWILGAKLKAKWTKNWIIWPLLGKLAEVTKMIQNY